MKNQKGSILPFLLLSIAILVSLTCSLYLTKHFYEIRSGTEGFKSACNINSVLNCDIVASSKYSEIFGMPVSSFSAGWYITFFIIGLLSRIKETSRESKRIIFAMAVFSVFSSVYFLWLMAVVLHTYCLFCLVIDCSNIIILISAFLMKPIALNLHTLMDRYPGKIRIVFKNFPLNSECNYTITQTMHSFACEAARVGLCVEKQGRFKETYEAIFENQQKLAPGVSLELAKQMDSDMPLLLRCMVNEETSLKIAQDVSEGVQLGVEATPTLFFNGHKVKGAIPLSLWEKMIDLTLSQQSLVKITK